jgi:hypothetical protein
MRIQSIWIEAENWELGELNPADANTSVVVTLEDGSIWTATFFTYRNVLTLVESYKSDSECLNGKYFWAWDMILVDEVTRERIEEVVRHFFEEREFSGPFRECSEHNGILFPRYNNRLQPTPRQHGSQDAPSDEN